MKIANINKAYLGADLINGIGNQYVYMDNGEPPAPVINMISGTVVNGTSSLQLMINSGKADSGTVECTIDGNNFYWVPDRTVTSLKNMYRSGTTITTIDINLPDHDVEDMYAMLYASSGLTSANINVGGGASSLDIAWVFSKIQSISAVTLDTNGFSGTCNMDNAFQCITQGGVKNLEYVTFLNFYPKVTMMKCLFDCNYKLSPVTVTGLKNFDVSQCTNMESAFYGFGNGARQHGTTLDLAGWNTSNVTNMKKMFMYVFVDVIDLTGWDMSGVVDKNYSNQMFSEMGYVRQIILNNTSEATFTKIKNRMAANGATTSYEDSYLEGSTRNTIHLIRDGYDWTYSNNAWSSTPITT